MPRLSLIVATCKKFFLENLYLLTYKNLKTIHGLKSTVVKKFKKTKQKNTIKNKLTTFSSEFVTTVTGQVCGCVVVVKMGI
jgi:hypothetical protein